MQGKVVIITGANSGIGLATARLLAQQGVSLVLGARREAELQKVGKELGATWRATDVVNKDDMAALVELAVKTHGKVDVLVNSAGIGPVSRFEELRVDEWDAMVDINLRGVLHGIAAVLPHFKNSGHIVNIVSTAGIKMVPTMGVYAATKNAVRTLTEILRQESPHLRVTEISPGMIATDFVSNMPPSSTRDALLEATKIAIPPDAIARGVLYALEQPADVEIGSIVIRPTAQG